MREGEKPFIIFGAPRYIPGQRQQALTHAAEPQVAPAPAPIPPTASTPPAPPASNGGGIFRPPPMIEVFDYTQTVAEDPDYVEPSWEVPLTRGDLSTLDELVPAPRSR